MHAEEPIAKRADVARPGKIAGVLALFVLVALLSGCAAKQSRSMLTVDVEVLDSLTRYERVYLLQPGDQIEVFIYRHPELSRKVVVRPDGFISLPLLNDIEAQGHTAEELAQVLVEKLGRRIRAPEVSVLVENPPEPVVFVLGEVGVPQSVTLREAGTVAQALARTGATPKNADLSSISLVRLNGEGLMEAHTVNAAGFSQPEIYMALNNMRLLPNDLIVVPESYRGQMMRLIQDFNTAITPYIQLRILQQITAN